MQIKIEVDANSCDARVLSEDGTRLGFITECDIELRPSKAPEARLTFLLPNVQVNAKATVSEEHLRELAAAHGYALVKG